VPLKLVSIVKGKFISKKDHIIGYSLGTSDLTEAKKRRDLANLEWGEHFEKASEALLSGETYTPVSGDFLGIIEYKDDQIENEFIAGKTSIPEGEVRLEVLQNVHDYIQSGHTESIYFDDTHFNVKSGPSISDFQGFRTFAYKLEKTN